MSRQLKSKDHKKGHNPENKRGRPVHDVEHQREQDGSTDTITNSDDNELDFEDRKLLASLLEILAETDGEH